MNRNRIRLTESDLHRIIKESVRKVVNEALNEAYGTASKSDIADFQNFSQNSTFKGMKPNGNIGWDETTHFIDTMSSLRNAQHYAELGAREEAWLKAVPFEQKTMIQKYYSKVLNNINKALELMYHIQRILE